MCVKRVWCRQVVALHFKINERWLVNPKGLRELVDGWKIIDVTPTTDHPATLS